MQCIQRGLKVLGLFGVLACFSAVPTEAQAGHLGTFKLRNSSNVAIRYEIKWGEDSEWVSHVVYPGYAKCHSFELDEYGRAPAPSIRFDSVGGDGDVTWRIYALNFYSTWSQCDGKPYVFRYSRSGVYLDLFSE